MSITAVVPNFAERVQQGRERILVELRKAIVGQDEVVDEVLIALFTGGHCLITGVPGLAKTLLIKTIAEILDLRFKRIQFTPDLMPADITGTEILDEQHGTRTLRFVHGPIFAQIILADEINRTPPKTQAALLEAMQEFHVTAAGRTYPLERPFFVLATQNPIELEGTYPLPEAQLDRFMFNVVMTYLPEDDEVRVVTETTGTDVPNVTRVLNGADILEFQRIVRQVVVTDEIARYAVRLASASRPGQNGSPDFVDKYVKWGAGLRASQALILGGKARALMHGRHHVSIRDIQALAAAHPAPSHSHQLLRGIRAPHCRQRRRTPARSGAGAEKRPGGMNDAGGRETRASCVFWILRPSRVWARWSSKHVPSSKGFYPGFIAVLSRASASNSPNTGNTFPAMTCRRSTGKFTHAAIAITSRSSKKKQTSTVICCWMSARRWVTSRAGSPSCATARCSPHPSRI